MIKLNEEQQRRARIEARIANPAEDLGTQIELRPVPRFDPSKQQADVFGAGMKEVAHG